LPGVISTSSAVLRRPVHLVLALAACALLALPASAAAENYVVNSAGDGGQAVPGPLCETMAPNQCTLRAAIQAANFESGFDTIDINAAIPQITLGSPLPPIEHTLTLFGHSNFEGSLVTPTVGLSVPSGAAGLKVEGANVTIEDMAIGGGSTGIEVSGENFIAHGIWLGLAKNGDPEPISQAGMVLTPSADNATISSGESANAPRNVFAHSPHGISIEGASGAKVRGSYLGVAPDGKTVAGVTIPVSIADSGASEATDDEIGGELTNGAESTPACDGACNVIASKEGFGIDLSGGSCVGTAAPTGPTAIRGNYIGLDATGLEPVEIGSVAEEAQYGILAVPLAGACLAAPGGLTVGGARPTDTNYLVGGSTAITTEHQGEDELTVTGNAIGMAADGSESTSPADLAIGVFGFGASGSAQVVDNQMILNPDATGVMSTGFGARIAENTIAGGFEGIRTQGGLGPGAGNQIVGNTLDEPDVYGIRLRDDLNLVTGNTIQKSGKYGIYVESGANGNRIGGDAPGEANTIDQAGSFEFQEGAAIEIDGDEASRNEVAANTGILNFGPFIHLAGDSSGEIPNGLKPPAIAAAFQSSATGTAEPGTTVRVFVKSSLEAGELGAYLGKFPTGADGVWKATFPSQPTGTLIAATQTSKAGEAEAGTSEVSPPLAAAADRGEETGGGGGGGDNGGGSGGSSDGGATPTPTPAPIAAPAPTRPKVKITKGPKKSSTATKATFRFKAEPPAGAKFECRLDGGRWAKCSSPKTYKNLKSGRHTFRVRAKAGALAGPVTKYQFTVAT
jgi:CSLREA domain-containing protein